MVELVDIKQFLKDRYTNGYGGSVTIGSIAPDIGNFLLLSLVIDSWYTVLSGKALVSAWTNIPSNALHLILAIVVCALTVGATIVNGEEMLGDIWYKVEDWKLFTFKK